jgi:hypothetical protein
MMQRLDDLKLQLHSSTRRSSGGGAVKAGEEHILQSGLSAAAAALEASDSHDSNHLKQKQQLLDQQQLQCSLPHLHLQLELYASDSATPPLSLQHEADIMAAAQQGR